MGIMTKLEKLKARHKKAKESFDEMRPVLEDSYKYSLPDRGYFNTLVNGKRTTKVYDSTAIIGVGNYADKLQSNLTPAWRKWFILVPGSEIPEDMHAAIQPKLDEITEILYDHINHSNFNTKVNEAYQDVAISTGILTCEEGDGLTSSLVFDSKAVENVVFEPSSDGILDNTFTTFKKKIRDIEADIPRSKLSAGLIKKMTQDPEAEVTLIESVTLNDALKYDHKVWWDSDEDVILDVVDDTTPYIIFRERVTSKGRYGMGRIIQLLADIKILNKIVEMDLKNAGMAISGVFTGVDDGIFNPYTVRFIPGTVIPVGSNNNANPSLRRVPTGDNFNIAAIKIEQKQEFITKVLFGMPLGSITKTPVRSATEMEIRSDDTFEMTNAAFSRFQTELLERLIKRCVDILSKAGKIQPIIVDGKEITIKFTSPLAKRQDMEDNKVIVNFAQTMLATGIPPETIGRKVKIEEVPRYVGENMGIPSKLFRNENEETTYLVRMEEAAMRVANAGGQQNAQ
jgi:hypothetical protein